MNLDTKTADFLELLQSSKKGKLKAYIGSIAGVGKTYRMLKEAHELKSKGIDIVVGLVETHGRKDTEELLQGLEIVQRFSHHYHDIIVDEMDLDAIISRNPQVVIVDELAHSNLPVCRNQKRYQDVIELLLSGINVICAFNIQHLESLNDIIENATGVKVSETIPDSFLNQSDQIVNIDLATEDILDRLKSGKIYKDEKIPQALQNFFKIENLGQLRELALREVAERIEKPLISNVISNITPNSRSSSDRLMVCLSPEDISQQSLLRKASRLAGKLNTDWFVVYIETLSDKPELIDSAKQRHLYSDIQLAQQLGAEFIQLRATERFNGWLHFAESEGIRHIVLSNRKSSFIENLFNSTLIHKFLSSNRFEIHIIPTSNKLEEEAS